MFYLSPANKRRAWPTPHKATGNSTRRNSLHSAATIALRRGAQEEGERQTKNKDFFFFKRHKLSMMCIVVSSYHLSGTRTLFGQQTSNKPRGESSGCAPICALKVRIDKHLQSRKRRHFAKGSQAVNLNQGVFFTHFTAGAIHFFCLCR